MSKEKVENKFTKLPACPKCGKDTVATGYLYKNGIEDDDHKYRFIICDSCGDYVLAGPPHVDGGYSHDEVEEIIKRRLIMLWSTPLEDNKTGVKNGEKEKSN